MTEENIHDTIPDTNTLHNVEDEEDFATLFEKSGTASKRLEPGQKVSARIVSISGDFAFIDLGGKSEGVINLNEFLKEDGTYSVSEGDTIEAFFVAFSDGLKRFTSRTKGYSTVDLQGIRNAYEANLPVNGKVTSELKGGFEVHVGKIRCFCPFSHIDLKGERKSELYINQTFPFKVLEYKENGRNVILSRRVLLEEEQEERLKKFKESLQVGMEVTGKVRAIQKFGAFVDLGGIDGLIPSSELSWNRAEKAESLLSQGQEVTVRIIAIDWARNRLTLSIKSMQPDPYTSAAEKYPIDSMVKGTVVRLESFGAFVNLEPGIDGLIPVSKFGTGRRIKHPKEVVEVGQFVEARIIDVNAANRKITLSMEQKINLEEIQLPAVSDIVQGTVERVIPAGLFLKIGDYLTGFIPNSEMGTPRGTNHNRMFPPGTIFQAIVIEVDKNRKKVTLSRNKVDEKIEEDTYNSYRDSVKKEERATGGLGSLGDLLREKWGSL
ncbi:MAG: 30S ribosomal protein S1 [Syntrophorhabdus sp. PtaU1.Bin058]|nr:MAG: 30S ribosomal protein S1 [Syntrophorhabdus sp. PtaU1.Bin058]